MRTLFEKIKGGKKQAAGFFCALLLCAALVIYTDTYRKINLFGEDTLTVGVFSDSYWGVQNGYSYRILEDAIALFEERHPSVHVEYVSGILKDDYQEWLSEQFISGTAPDVFFISGEFFSSLAQLGALRDLSALTGEPDFEKESFYSSAYQIGSYQGKQFALPYECAPKLMYVNKSILDREGLAIPENNWTWDDFYTLCSQVTKDTDHNGTIDQFGVAGYTWEDAFDSNGVTLFSGDGTQCHLADDKAGQAISFIERLEALKGEYQVTEKAFDLGKVAFRPMSFSEYRAYKPYPLSIKKYAGFEWECIPMPAGPSGDNRSKLDTLLVAMNARTAKERYAWEFMKILTLEEQIQSEIFDYSEGVSVLKKVTESDQTLQLLMQDSGSGAFSTEILSNAVESAVTVSEFRDYDEALERVDRALQAIMNSNSNISMEQNIANREINNYLRNRR